MVNNYNKKNPNSFVNKKPFGYYSVNKKNPQCICVEYYPLIAFTASLTERTPISSILP